MLAALAALRLNFRRDLSFARKAAKILAPKEGTRLGYVWVVVLGGATARVEAKKKQNRMTHHTFIGKRKCFDGKLSKFLCLKKQPTKHNYLLLPDFLLRQVKYERVGL